MYYMFTNCYEYIDTLWCIVIHRWRTCAHCYSLVIHSIYGGSIHKGEGIVPLPWCTASVQERGTMDSQGVDTMHMILSITVITCSASLLTHNNTVIHYMIPWCYVIHHDILRTSLDGDTGYVSCYVVLCYVMLVMWCIPCYGVISRAQIPHLYPKYGPF